MITVIAKLGVMIGKMLSRRFAFHGPPATMEGDVLGLSAGIVAGAWLSSMGRENTSPVGIAMI